MNDQAGEEFSEFVKVNTDFVGQLTRRAEQAEAEVARLREVLWAAIHMYDNGGFVGDNVDRWFNGLLFLMRKGN